jgi:hypothetical protein
VAAVFQAPAQGESEHRSARLETDARHEVKICLNAGMINTFRRRMSLVGILLFV